MSEDKGHVDGIKKSIEEVIGSNTVLKNKRSSSDDIQREKFEKIILALEAAEVRTSILGSDFKLDLSDYNEYFYTAIDGLMSLWLGKEACELIFFYIYERQNPDGSMNVLLDQNDVEITLSSPSDLWFLVNHIKNKTKKVNKK